MIPSPDINDKGLLVNTTAELIIELEQLLMSLSDLLVDLESISCSTNGLKNVTKSLTQFMIVVLYYMISRNV